MGRIVLTFRNNEKEKAIEEFLNNKVQATAYIKELVWSVMNNKETTVTDITSSEPLKNTEKPQKPKVGKLMKK